MTHEDETTFQDRVEQYLIVQYGEDNVSRNHYLDDTYRFCDFWVNGPVVTLAIEVENDAESIIHGVGQAQLYAAHSEWAVPVVIVPSGHLEQPEVNYLRRTVPVVELDV